MGKIENRSGYFYKKKQIESRPVWKPLHLQPVFAECESIGGNVAEDLFTHGLCLPSGSNLTNEDLNKVIETIIEAKNCHLLS